MLMNIQKKSILIALAITLTLPAGAKHPARHHWQGNQEETSALRVSYEKPGLVISNRNFEFEIEGTVRGTASFDWGDPLPNPNSFTVYDLEQQTPGNGAKFGLSAQQSSISFAMRILKGSKHEIGIHFSTQFMGDDYAPELEELFATYRGFKVGYGYGLFCDEDAMPYTIDDQGPNSALLVENGIFNYSHEFDNGIGLGIGAEMPLAAARENEKSELVTQRVPDIPFFVQYGWSADSYVRLGGIVRTMSYRNFLRDKNGTNVGWGVKLSGTARIIPNLRAFWQAAYGEGISSYFQDFADADLDMISTADGKMKGVKTWGGYASLQYDFSTKVFAGAGYSYLRNYGNKKAGYLPLDTYRHGQYIFANVFYNIHPQVQWGIEYIYGNRKNMDRTNANDSRLQTMLQISF